MCLHKVLPVAVFVLLVKVVVVVAVVDVIVVMVGATACIQILRLFHLSAKWSRFFWSPSREKTGGKRGRGGREHGNGSFKTVIYEIIFSFFVIY